MTHAIYGTIGFFGGGFVYSFFNDIYSQVTSDKIIVRPNFYNLDYYMNYGGLFGFIYGISLSKGWLNRISR